MEYITIRLIFLALSASLVTSQKVSASPKIQYVKVGQPVMFKCHASDHDLLKETFAIYKVSLNKDDPQQLEFISKMVLIEEKYKKEMKINATQSQEGEDETLTLTVTITAAAEMNDGKYLCAILNPEQKRIAEAELELVILKPVAMVSLQIGKYTSTSDSNSQIVLKTYKPRPVTCTVKGGNPAPTVKIIVGDEDITADVVKYAQINLTTAVNGESFNGIRSRKYVIHSSKIMKKEYIGKKIKCIGYTENSTQIQKVASATVILNEPPVFKCEDKKVVIGKGTTISCEITHQIKPVEMARWVEQHTQTVIVPGAKIKNYEARMDRVDNKTVRAFLDIEKVPLRTNIYELEVDHMGWQNSHKVRVVTNPAPTPPVRRTVVKPGAAVGLQSTAPLLIALTTLLVLIQAS